MWNDQGASNALSATTRSNANISDPRQPKRRITPNYRPKLPLTSSNRGFRIGLGCSKSRISIALLLMKGVARLRRRGEFNNKFTSKEELQWYSDILRPFLSSPYWF